MKQILLNLFFMIFCLCMISCGDDGTGEGTGLDYSVNIIAPTADDKNVDDLIQVSVDFNSGTGGTVHHVNVKIYNKMDATEIVYNNPDDAHVHETDGAFEFRDEFMLSNSNGVNEHTDWILEAKVWGHEAGAAEVLETLEFHVHL